ncbi:MAG: hypothetical protein V6Z86_05395 [Hyphomicrobiales bacterium]
MTLKNLKQGHKQRIQLYLYQQELEALERLSMRYGAPRSRVVGALVTGAESTVRNEDAETETGGADNA